MLSNDNKSTDNKSSTKKLILGLVLLYAIVFALISIPYLFNDEPLNPEAQKWLNHYLKPPNLEKNAYIELMALGLDSENPYQTAKQSYLAAQLEKQDNLVNGYQQLATTSITGLRAALSSNKYCYFIEDDCFEQLQKHSSAIQSDIKFFEDKLTRFQQLSDYNNFDYLGPFTGLNQLDILYLYRLSGIQAYYLIKQEELDKAATLIEKLIKLDRELIQKAQEKTILLLPTINFEALYTPLIAELYKRNFNNWNGILAQLKPIDIVQISTNRILLQNFAETVKILRGMKIHENAAQHGILNQYYSLLVYKENITINDMFAFTQTKLLNEVSDKEELFKQINLASQKRAVAEEQTRNATNNILWKSFKSIRNFKGTMVRLLITRLDVFVNFEKNIVELDLQILLLNALIQSQTTPISDIINSEAFTNPYNGKKTFMEKNKLCLHAMDDSVCLNIAFNTE